MRTERISPSCSRTPQARIETGRSSSPASCSSAAGGTVAPASAAVSSASSARRSSSLTSVLTATPLTARPSVSFCSTGLARSRRPSASIERGAGRQRAPREQEHLVGARAGAALALEVAEDADLRAQHVGLEGLEHVVDGARLVAAGDLGDVGAHRGQEDDRRRAAALAPADELRGLEAVHARHLHVEQDDGEVLLQQRLERLLARPGRAQAHLQRLEHRREREQVLRPVVDEQDARRVVYRCSHTRMRESSWSTSTGLVM